MKTYYINLDQLGSKHRATVYMAHGLAGSTVHLPGNVRLICSSHKAACIIRDLINLHVGTIENDHAGLGDSL
jgi:hypothetical protein